MPDGDGGGVLQHTQVNAPEITASNTLRLEAGEVKAGALYLGLGEGVLCPLNICASPYLRLSDVRFRGVKELAAILGPERHLVLFVFVLQKLGQDMGVHLCRTYPHGEGGGGRPLL